MEDTSAMPRPEMVLGASESSLTTREALLSMLNAYLETKGFLNPFGRELILLHDANVLFDLCQEASYQPHQVISRLEDVFRREASAEKYRTIQHLGLCIKRLQEQFRHEIHRRQG